MTLKVSRTFRPSSFGTAVLFLLATLFATLGTWQTKRAIDKAETEEKHRSATTVAFETALAENQRFARINVSGHYDPVRHILLDNQIWKGRAGVHVFTPFYSLDGNVILVNRGWLPLTADRRIMSEIPTPEHETALSGMLNLLPVPGRILGQPDEMTPGQWPQLVTYLKIDDISRLLDVELENWIIQLSESDPAGFKGRDWKPVFLSSDRHRAYAFQWFSFMTVTLVLWLVTGFRKKTENSK